MLMACILSSSACAIFLIRKEPFCVSNSRYLPKNQRKILKHTWFFVNKQNKKPQKAVKKAPHPLNSVNRPTCALFHVNL